MHSANGMSFWAGFVIDMQSNRKRLFPPIRSRNKRIAFCNSFCNEFPEPCISQRRLAVTVEEASH